MTKHSFVWIKVFDFILLRKPEQEAIFLPEKMKMLMDKRIIQDGLIGAFTATTQRKFHDSFVWEFTFLPGATVTKGTFLFMGAPFNYYGVGKFENAQPNSKEVKCIIIDRKENPFATMVFVINPVSEDTPVSPVPTGEQLMVPLLRFFGKRKKKRSSKAKQKKKTSSKKVVKKKPAKKLAKKSSKRVKPKAKPVRKKMSAKKAFAKKKAKKKK